MRGDRVGGFAGEREAAAAEFRADGVSLARSPRLWIGGRAIQLLRERIGF
jgi:hypothetical protein